MANITRISAKDPNKASTDKLSKKEKKLAAKAAAKTKEVEVPAEKPAPVAKEAKKAKKEKKTFILFRPFVALGHYLRDSWLEIRQVRWPNRKTTWKMVLAVIVYTAIFVILIMLLDALFEFLFNLLLK